MSLVQFCNFFLEEVILSLELLDLHEVAAILVDVRLRITEALRLVRVQRTKDWEEGRL